MSGCPYVETNCSKVAAIGNVESNAASTTAAAFIARRTVDGIVVAMALVEAVSASYRRLERLWVCWTHAAPSTYRQSDYERQQETESGGHGYPPTNGTRFVRTRRDSGARSDEGNLILSFAGIRFIAIETPACFMAGMLTACLLQLARLQHYILMTCELDHFLDEARTKYEHTRK